jgi:hypothetical protein
MHLGAFLAWMPEVKPMSISIQAKTDYSSLIQAGTSSKDSFNSMSWLKDYGMVKSGAYSKLMKAYYSKDGASDSVSKLASDKAKAVSSKNTVSDSYNKVSEAASSVQDAIKKVREADDEDKDLLLSAVKSYVSSYNSMMEAANGSDVKDNSSISSRITVLSSLHSGYTEKLAAVGIEAKSDGTLKLDEDKLKKADSKDVKDLFAERSSYGYSVSVSAGMVQSNANYAATRTSLYDSTAQAASGAYGYMFDSFT